MPKTQYWLKMADAADDPLDNRWIESNPELLREVRAPRRPSGIKQNDLFVYYAATRNCIFALGRAKMDGESCLEVLKPGAERWPWLLEVQVRLTIPTLRQAPDWKILGIESRSVQQQSYIEISRDQYALAWEAIAERGKP
jgi:hypothetical protein